jgi:CDP-diglyceride synthetase
MELLLALLLAALVAAAGAAILHQEPADGAAHLAGGVLVVTIAAMLSALIRIAVGVNPDAASGPLLTWLDAGRTWLLVTVLTVWAYDTVAYVVGRLFPRGRFFTHISPNKTWSGAVGGLAGAVVAGYLLGILVGRPFEGFGLGVLVGLVAPVGDLTESMLKRAAGVKDSSRLVPGHGGLLDRLDSFIAVAPVAWLYLLLVNLAS